MKIKIKFKTSQRVKRTTLEFNIKGIIRDFYSFDEPGEQVRFIEKKRDELIQADSARSRMSLFSKMKMAYLVDILHMELVLSGLLRMANEESEPFV